MAFRPIDIEQEATDRAWPLVNEILEDLLLPQLSEYGITRLAKQQEIVMFLAVLFITGLVFGDW